MRVLGANLARESATGTPVPEHTVILLGPDGKTARLARVGSLPAMATVVAQMAAGEPFVLGVDVPVVSPESPARGRPVEALLRRRLGYRLLAQTRSGSGPGGGRRFPSGETLMAGLAAAGQPCLPYPDRDRRQPGLAETHPGLNLKALLWETSHLASAGDHPDRPMLFRAFEHPPYRPSLTRTGWAGCAAGMDLVIRALAAQAGFDLDPAREALAKTASEADAERAAGTLDALLAAGTLHRYLEAPETCLFLGDVEHGYVILPADGLVRRLALTGRAGTSPRLFPQASLRERLGREALVRAIDLLDLPGRPQRIEATFREPPHYEFDNLDEMLWWKHVRHLAGPVLPLEGLSEMQVDLGLEDAASLRLLRSRHRTLSFRFEPAVAWRSRCPTRDGRTYPFRVLRALYETLPSPD